MFDTQTIVQAIQNSLGRNVVDGETLVLILTANLLAEFGGSSIIGEDVIVIQRKGSN